MRIIFLLLCLSIVVYGEDWTVDGKDYHNVKVGQVETDQVHITYDGGIGSLPLADLSPALQKRFGYNPSQAKDAAQKREADQQAAIQSYASVDQKRQVLQLEQAKENAQQAQRQVTQKMASHAALMYAQIVQILPNGLLVEPYVKQLTDPNEIGTYGMSSMQPSGETVFISCNPQGHAENESINIKAYRDGTFTYQDTSGASRTIQKYVAAN